MQNSNLPTAIRSRRLKIADDLEITVHVLDDGQPIISEDDLVRLFEWLEGKPTIDMTDAMTKINEATGDGEP